MADTYFLLTAHANPDGSYQPWAVYQYMPGLTNRQAHRFAREDRKTAGSDLVAVRKIGTGFPKPARGQCCSLIEQFIPPYPASC